MKRERVLTLTDAPPGDAAKGDHAAAVELLHRIIAGRNSVRRP